MKFCKRMLDTIFFQHLWHLFMPHSIYTTPIIKWEGIICYINFSRSNGINFILYNLPPNTFEINARLYALIEGHFNAVKIAQLGTLFI